MVGGKGEVQDDPSQEDVLLEARAGTANIKSLTSICWKLQTQPAEEFQSFPDLCAPKDLGHAQGLVCDTRSHWSTCVLHCIHKFLICIFLFGFEVERANTDVSIGNSCSRV